jgi:hypothetical protein
MEYYVAAGSESSTRLRISGLVRAIDIDVLSDGD